MNQPVGFAGIGIMGAGMARNIAKAGFALHVWNRTAANADALVADGATRAAAPVDLARAAEIIVICVKDAAAVEDVCFGPGGIIGGATPGRTLVIDCSTIAPSSARAIAERLSKNGIGFVDAPVSGGSEGARLGTLSIMAGGDVAHHDRALPVLRAMGKTIVHMGAVGTGQMTKMVNQSLAANGMLAVCEALVLAQAGGLPLDRVLEALGAGAAGSWAWSNRGPKIAARDFAPGFMISLMQKDLRLVLQAADEMHVPMPATSLVHQLYQGLERDGLGGDGNHALVKALEKLSGIVVGEK